MQKGKKMRKVISTDNAPGAAGPYSQAIIANGFIFISAQIPLEPETGKLVTGDIKVQTERVLENLKAILKEAGTDLSNTVKVVVYLADINNFAVVNEVYACYFSSNPPARSAIQATLPLGAKIAMDLIAVTQ